ncbi:NAD(P)-binding protein [Rhizopogon vinicolor AM-OR11-026]|uniref:NAD(P)-binding protein n=1 Tax=Rhizopogon vinicolor AM-OR11-026 TaxID=1314800 RepID=A0A1B7NCP6_9AGAM|nr:NAD(P)-binding protein [Rhizopogon vinicolor AM-OR11-026]
MSPRIVAVFGATGTQGSSIVQALLADGTFIPRAVTRNPNSEKAIKLKTLGAEVAQADLWDIDSLKQVLSGVEAVYGVTDYYDPKNTAQGHNSEMLLGKNLVDAAEATNVKYFIWSSLPHSTRVSNGKYPNVYHFDNKANVEDYLRDSGVPHSILHTGWFAENLWNYNNLVPAPDSTGLELTVPRYDPHSPQYITWIERDLGQCAVALLKHYEDRGSEVLSQTFYAVSAKLSYTRFASILQQALGKPVSFVSSQTTGMQELDDMYAFQSEFGLYPHTAIPDPRLVNLGVKFHTMEELSNSQVVKSRYA